MGLFGKRKHVQRLAEPRHLRRRVGATPLTLSLGSRNYSVPGQFLLDEANGPTSKADASVHRDKLSMPSPHDGVGGPGKMMRRSLLTVLLVLVATTSLAAAPPVNPADAIAFMNQLWNRAIELLNNKTDPAMRQARF